MNPKLKLTAFAALLALIAGCELDAHQLAPVIGERNASLLSAGGQFLNAMSLSEKDEDTIGQSVAVSVTNSFPLVRSDNLQRYVNLVGLTVANASPNPGGNWVFGVVDTPMVNAFSGPNGYVFITRGALELMLDEAALAGVLAHEIAHVANHDGLKQVQANQQKGALVKAMQAADSRTAQLAALADNGVDVITKQGYDQPQEFKADEDAVRIVSAAGYDPNSYLAFLRRLQASAGAGRGGSVMSTHPGIASRLARVDAAIRALPPAAPTPGATLQPRFTSNMQSNGIQLR
jgi:predicted Zn-dependent protease